MSLAVPDFLKPMLARPVAIFGGGVSGGGVRELLEAIGAEARVYDMVAEKGAPFSADAAGRHGLVVCSPGFPPDHPWITAATAGGADCVGELDFASLFWRGRVIAITGTNGKTTLTELLTHALRIAGREAHATGNIGQPLSRTVAATRGGEVDTIAVCEVSSFQAEVLRHLRAEATLWTNFAEDHLERHANLGSYFGAKWNLVTRSGALCVGPGARRREQEADGARGAEETSGRCSLFPSRARGVFIGTSVGRYARQFGRPLAGLVTVPTEDQPADPRLAQTVFASYPQRENFLLAAAWWRAAGFDEAALLAAAHSFQPGAHRLVRVAEHAGVTYWNDSKATNFHAVEAALSRFPEPVVLIAGGKSKGGDLAGFVHRVAERVKHAVLIGETSADLAVHCSVCGVAHTRCASLAEALHRASEVVVPGGHVLLSPGFASFDMFRSYEDRGARFEELVHNLGAPAGSLG